MKKKLLAVSLVIALFAITIVGGSLAWFTDTDQATNVFTVGSVKVEQIEDFVSGSPLLPIVNTDNPAEDENYVKKVVTIENQGKNDAYVRTHIAIPSQLMGYVCLDTNESPDSDWVYEGMSAATVGEMAYTVFTYRYETALGTDDADKTSEVLLKGVYMDAKVDLKDNPATPEKNYEFCIWNATENKYDFSGYEVFNENMQELRTVNVLVATQAVQAEGFADAKTALDSAFGTTLPSFE